MKFFCALINNSNQYAVKLHQLYSKMFTTTYISVYYSFFKDTNWLFSNEKFLRRETDRLFICLPSYQIRIIKSYYRIIQNHRNDDPKTKHKQSYVIYFWLKIGVHFYSTCYVCIFQCSLSVGTIIPQQLIITTLLEPK